MISSYRPQLCEYSEESATIFRIDTHAPVASDVDPGVGHVLAHGPSLYKTLDALTTAFELSISVYGSKLSPTEYEDNLELLSVAHALLGHIRGDEE